jgi:glycerol uptake facilitator-like aquaporin
MNWLDELVHGFIVMLGIEHPAEANRPVAKICIGGLLLVLALSGLAM